VHVRVHIFFLLFALLTMFLASESRTPNSDLVAIAAGSLAILFFSVVLHEAGHLVATFRLGGVVEEMQIGPWGGLIRPVPPRIAGWECATQLAGPAVNLAISLLAAGFLLILVPTEVVGLFKTLSPQNLIEGPSAWIIGLKLVCWINWVLCVVNLVPAFPFDAGFALRALLRSLWPDTPPRTTTFVVTLLAKIAAVALLVWAWFIWSQPSEQVIPLWFSLVLLAILLYFGARQEESVWSHDEETSEEGFTGYDFSEGYTSLERSSERLEQGGGQRPQRLDERREAKQRRQLEIEAEEERRADEILGRLHEVGMSGLSEEEQLLLQRVSARYRQRHGDQT
jgi:Zn-dependent protease